MNRANVLSICGLLVCSYALQVEYAKEASPDYHALCDISEFISCSKVLTSPYGRGFGLIKPGHNWLYQRDPIFGLLYYGLLLLLGSSSITMLWYLTAAFLYVEMFVVLLLLLPIFSSRSWNKFFKLNWVQKVATFSTYYFNFFLVTLGLVLVEAIRQVMHQRQAFDALKLHPSELRPETEALYLMRMFRAQRNLYIAGFALFLWFVFRRLVNLISEHAKISASQEASIKQAKSASEAAARMLGDQKSDESAELLELKSKLECSNKLLEEEKEAHQTTKTDLGALKKQANQTAQEYDRVSTECQELQRRLTILSGSTVDKKSD